MYDNQGNMYDSWTVAILGPCGVGKTAAGCSGEHNSRLSSHFTCDCFSYDPTTEEFGDRKYFKLDNRMCYVGVNHNTGPVEYATLTGSRSSRIYSGILNRLAGQFRKGRRFPRVCETGKRGRPNFRAGREQS
ncbi:hypothetical protein B0H14DRAFT_2782753 [Mycena olivaceomarginata]|nr:hypothetical protein B0H14DRAFT_2782753 [Mycena olivaceomarginata]